MVNDTGVRYRRGTPVQVVVMGLTLSAYGIIYKRYCCAYLNTLTAYSQQNPNANHQYNTHCTHCNVGPSTSWVDG